MNGMSRSFGIGEAVPMKNHRSTSSRKFQVEGLSTASVAFMVIPFVEQRLELLISLNCRGCDPRSMAVPGQASDERI
jgi:hypothetical protein